MYSLVLLLSGIFPFPAMHSLLVTLFACFYTTTVVDKADKYKEGTNGCVCKVICVVQQIFTA